MLNAIQARQLVNTYNNGILSEIEFLIRGEATKGGTFLQTGLLDAFVKVDIPLDQQDEIIRKTIQSLVDAGFTYRLNLDRFGPKGGPPMRLTIYW